MSNGMPRLDAMHLDVLREIGNIGAGNAARVRVSPTGAPCTSLMLAVIQPTSPAPSFGLTLRLGVKTPT